MQGLIFHRLKGINGWSKLSINNLDVYNIINYEYNKREFTIFNQEYPYTLSIKYNYPTQEFALTCGIPFVTVILNDYVKLHHDITKRYKTEECIINEINEIKEKQKKLELIKENLLKSINYISDV